MTATSNEVQEQRAKVDTTQWDGGRAVAECQSEADLRKVCALEHTDPADPSLKAHWGLPHHFLSAYPAPNEGGVKAALQAAPKATNCSDAARADAIAHLQNHMRAINPDYQGGSSSAMQHGEYANSLVALEGSRVEFRMPVSSFEIRHSGRPDTSFTVRGYAAVYNQPSLPLVTPFGKTFVETIAEGAFDGVLGTNPDVKFTWDHDTRWTMASTLPPSSSLHLRSDTRGLYMDASCGQYSWCDDLRKMMVRGDVNQGSFAFDVGDDEWDERDDGTITRTIRSVDRLYDVTVTAQGAYPQTSLVAARSLLAAAGFAIDDTLVSSEGESASGHGVASGEGVTARVLALHDAVRRSREDLDALGTRTQRLRR